MKYLGDFAYGGRVIVPFSTFNSSGASVTVTGFAVTDIEVYKGVGMTQRSSDNGFALIDTDGIDIDGVAGAQGFSIDLSDNSDAGFFAPGNDYFVILNSFTLDSQTVAPVICQFSIENRWVPALLARTTIATLASQQQFTLTAGSADDDAYNGALVVIQDAASVVQKAVGVIKTYTGSTKTALLRYDPGIFTMAVGDHIAVYAQSPVVADIHERVKDPYSGLGEIRRKIGYGVVANQLNDKGGMAMSTDGIEAFFNRTFDGTKMAGMTLEEVLCVGLCMLVAKLSGAEPDVDGNATPVVRNIGDTADVVEMSTTPDGRATVTITLGSVR
jgi:hypothetical protein